MRAKAQPHEVFAALGDPTRLAIVGQLCTGGPQSIARLTDGSQVTRQAVTKHLESLATAGLVRSDRAGRERIWRVETRKLVEAKAYLDHISLQWDSAIERLRAFVEEK